MPAQRAIINPRAPATPAIIMRDDLEGCEVLGNAELLAEWDGVDSEGASNSLVRLLVQIVIRWRTRVYT